MMLSDESRIVFELTTEHDWQALSFLKPFSSVMTTMMAIVMPMMAFILLFAIFRRGFLMTEETLEAILVLFLVNYLFDLQQVMFMVHLSFTSLTEVKVGTC